MAETVFGRVEMALREAVGVAHRCGYLVRLGKELSIVWEALWATKTNHDRRVIISMGREVQR